MNSELREQIKCHGFKRLINSFKYSFAGIKYAFKYEQSMTIHILIAVIIIILGLVLHISMMEWLFCFMLIGLVTATELINTSIEAVVDLTCPEMHPLAKIAKDTASAAVLVFALTALVSGLIIFLPKIIEFINHL